MHILIAIIVAFLVGAALATVYHTRIEPVAQGLRSALMYAKSDLSFWREEAKKAGELASAHKNLAAQAKFELADLRRRIEEKAKGLEKKL
jgi:hypothetical protein